MSEELAFFGRTGAYGIGIAAVYWFVSSDITGTVLLGMFGIATSAAFLLLLRTVWHSPLQHAEQPFGDEPGVVPLRSLAPLWLGAGVALAALGVVFGLWFFIAAAFPLAAGAGSWLGEVAGELRLAAKDDIE